jgi:hypothetical protein
MDFLADVILFFFFLPFRIINWFIALFTWSWDE